MDKFWEKVNAKHRPGRWNHPEVSMTPRGDVRISRYTWEMLECPQFVNV
ncbi:MAG: hypothetical protein JO314_09580, partial [Acidobacteria bacterium]|nr:hypothetical protein [Acidobacteriota bacterium]